MQLLISGAPRMRRLEISSDTRSDIQHDNAEVLVEEFLRRASIALPYFPLDRTTTGGDHTMNVPSAKRIGRLDRQEGIFGRNIPSRKTLQYMKHSSQTATGLAA